MTDFEAALIATATDLDGTELVDAETGAEVPRWKVQRKALGDVREYVRWRLTGACVHCATRTRPGADRRGEATGAEGDGA